MLQGEILDRYHQLRAISTRHHSGALDCLARPAILEQAKHLGLAYGQALVAESEEEMTLLFDLAIHTAKPGRSRAIDRYAKSVALQPGSDEELTLEAMRRAKFSLWRVDRRHEAAGVIVADLLRNSETWLVDEGLAFTAEPGMTARQPPLLANRFCPDLRRCHTGRPRVDGRSFARRRRLATARRSEPTG